jgi:Domain of unknown function (DUF4270)
VTTRLISILLFVFSALAIYSSCSKINEATDLGDGIIPGVDGVNTFDTIISVDTYNSIFDPLKDSVRVGRTNDHILGNISSDPLFGKTNAKIFLEMKPEFYKWNFNGVYNKDSLQIDSVVMILGWKGTYGDTLSPVRVRVWEMDQSNDFRSDTFLVLHTEYFTYSNLLGSKDILPYQLKDSVKAFRDTTAGQLRIKLNNSFGRRLLDYDTTNAYASDSAFKTYVRGLAIDADPAFGNALMAFGLVNNGNTKLAIYHRATKNGKIDTTVNYFAFTGASARHNFINRFDFAGTPLAAASGTPGADNLLYLINTPGSFATIKAPDLSYMSNRVVNRAELIMEQVYDISDDKFIQPEGLMLDVYDSTLNDYKYFPYDFIPDQSGVAYGQFGLYGRNTVDGSGNPIRVWKFNITRYVQNLLTKQVPLYDMRLFTAKSVFEFIREGYATNSGGYTYYSTNLNSQYAIGRVRIGGGNHPTQKMRIRIVYTKI